MRNAIASSIALDVLAEIDLSSIILRRSIAAASMLKAARLVSSMQTQSYP